MKVCDTATFNLPQSQTGLACGNCTDGAYRDSTTHACEYCPDGFFSVHGQSCEACPAGTAAVKTFAVTQARNEINLHFDTIANTLCSLMIGWRVPTQTVQETVTTKDGCFTPVIWILVLVMEAMSILGSSSLPTLLPLVLSTSLSRLSAPLLNAVFPFIPVLVFYM